jgi:hypothetical protein
MPCPDVDLTGRGPDYVFRDAGIDVQRTEKDELTDALEALHLHPVRV